MVDFYVHVLWLNVLVHVYNSRNFYIIIVDHNPSFVFNVNIFTLSLFVICFMLPVFSYLVMASLLGNVPLCFIFTELMDQIEAPS